MASSASAPLLDGLARRVTERTQPSARPPHDPNDPVQVLAQVVAALAQLATIRGAGARLCRARMLFEFIGHESCTSAELARAGGVERAAGARAHASLLRLGLLQGRRQGPGYVFRLTPWGEDWLLAVAKGEAPPARPGA